MRQVPVRRNVSSILLLTLFDEISITIGFPLLTFLCFDSQTRLFAPATSQAVRSYWYGVLSAAPHLVMIVSILLFGILADRFGRKKILIIGAFGALFLALASIVSILCSALVVLLVGMLFGGAFARTGAVAMAAINDISSQRNKLVNIGYLQTATSLGALIGPLVGGFFAKRYFFAQLNFAVPFIIAAVMAMVTVYITLFYFRDTHVHIKAAENSKWSISDLFAGISNLFRPKILQISLILILVQFSWRLYYQFMPPLLKLKFHVAPFTLGLFLAMVALFLCLATTLVLPRLNRFFTTKQILRFAIIFMGIGLIFAMVGLICPNQLWAKIFLWCSAMPVAGGDVIVFCSVSMLYSTAMQQSNQGAVMGLNMMLVSVVWAVVGLFGGVLLGINAGLPIIVAIVPIIIAGWGCCKLN